MCVCMLIPSPFLLFSPSLDRELGLFRSVLARQGCQLRERSRIPTASLDAAGILLGTWVLPGHFLKEKKERKMEMETIKMHMGAEYSKSDTRQV